MISPIAAAIQYAPVQGDVRKNIAIAQQMVFEAAAKGAKLIVLPELCLSGKIIENKNDAAAFSQQKNGYQTAALFDIARKYKCYIAMGYVELSEGKLYNSAVVLGPDGVVGNTRKRHLEGSDFLWASPGDDCIPPVVVTSEGRIGALITGDVVNKNRKVGMNVNENPLYTRGCIDTICLLTNWAGEYSYPDSKWIKLAEDVGCNVVVSNRLGVERELIFKGGSCVIDKNLQVWTYGSSFTESAVVGGALIL